MTEDPRGTDPQRDPVEAFFAAHRDRVQDEPPDDLTWARIVRESRRDARANRWVAALGMAAAAAVVAVGGYAIWPQITGQQTLPPASSGAEGTATSSPTNPAPPTTTPAPPTGTQPSAITAGPAPAQLPSDLSLTSIGTAADRVLYAAGRSTDGCATASGCTDLVWSTDDGVTWAAQADLTALGAVQLRFAGDIGWAWQGPFDGEGGLWRSADRGLTWTPVPHQGSTVMTLELHEGQLVSVTADCATDTCTNAAAVVSDTDARDLTDGSVALGEPQAVGARVSFAGTTPFVSLIDAQGGATVTRLQDGAATGLATAVGCTGSQLTFTGAVDLEQRAYLLCGPPGPSSVTTTYQLATSSEAGRVWSPAVTELTGGQGEGVDLAANDADHVVAVLGDRLQLSDDGGTSWHDPAQPPSGPWAGAQSRLMAAGGSTFYLLPVQSGADRAGFWRSTDHGDTWTQLLVTP